jgi:hypothetical protein
MSEITPE